MFGEKGLGVKSPMNQMFRFYKSINILFASGQVRLLHHLNLVRSHLSLNTLQYIQIQWWTKDFTSIFTVFI